MPNIKFVSPDTSFQYQYKEFMEEWMREKNWHKMRPTCLANAHPNGEGMGYFERNAEIGIKTYFAVLDNKIIGVVVLRKTEECASCFYRGYGGTIDFCVRPMYRRYGYGKEIFRLAIEKSGNSEELVLCDRDDWLAEKMIRSFGGKPIREVEDYDKKVKRLYSIKK